jgi:flagellar basal-body rod protein FlgG
MVHIDDTGKISVKENGAAAPTEIDSLALFDFDDLSKMQKVGDGLFGLAKDTNAIPIPDGEVRVRQCALESSNVDPVKEMVAMIFAIRQYEATQKAIQTAEEIEVANANKVGMLRP